VVDAEERTIDVNPALVDALGYSAEELRGRSPAEFLIGDSKATYEGQSILRRSGLTDSYPLIFRTRDGAARAVRVLCAPLFEDDRCLGKIAMLGSPVAGKPADSWTGLSHDLRNSLQAILGFSTLLGDESPGPLNPEQRRQLAMIGTAADEALAQVLAHDHRERAGRTPV
jgi:PAS domain S-box-containing protein